MQNEKEIEIAFGSFPPEKITLETSTLPENTAENTTNDIQQETNKKKKSKKKTKKVTNENEIDSAINDNNNLSLQTIFAPKVTVLLQKHLESVKAIFAQLQNSNALENAPDIKHVKMLYLEALNFFPEFHNLNNEEKFSWIEIQLQREKLNHIVHILVQAPTIPQIAANEKKMPYAIKFGEEILPLPTNSNNDRLKNVADFFARKNQNDEFVFNDFCKFFLENSADIDQGKKKLLIITKKQLLERGFKEEDFPILQKFFFRKNFPSSNFNLIFDKISCEKFYPICFSYLFEKFVDINYVLKNHINSLWFALPLKLQQTKKVEFNKEGEQYIELNFSSSAEKIIYLHLIYDFYFSRNKAELKILFPKIKLFFLSAGNDELYQLSTKLILPSDLFNEITLYHSKNLVLRFFTNATTHYLRMCFGTIANYREKFSLKVTALPSLALVKLAKKILDPSTPQLVPVQVMLLAEKATVDFSQLVEKMFTYFFDLTLQVEFFYEMLNEYLVPTVVLENAFPLAKGIMTIRKNFAENFPSIGSNLYSPMDFESPESFKHRLELFLQYGFSLADENARYGSNLNELIADECYGLVQALFEINEKCSVQQQLDINKVTPKSNFSALILAVVKYAPLHIIKLLLTKGVDINLADSEGRNALHYAMMQGRIEVIILLIQHNINAKLPDRYHFVPIDYIETQVLFPMFLPPRIATVIELLKSGNLNPQHEELFKSILEQHKNEKNLLEVVKFVITQLLTSLQKFQFTFDEIGNRTNLDYARSRSAGSNNLKLNEGHNFVYDGQTFRLARSRYYDATDQQLPTTKAILYFAGRERGIESVKYMAQQIKTLDQTSLLDEVMENRLYLKMSLTNLNKLFDFYPQNAEIIDNAIHAVKALQQPKKILVGENLFALEIHWHNGRYTAIFDIKEDWFKNIFMSQLTNLKIAFTIEQDSGRIIADKLMTPALLKICLCEANFIYANQAQMENNYQQTLTLQASVRAYLVRKNYHERRITNEKNLNETQLITNSK